MEETKDENPVDSRDSLSDSEVTDEEETETLSLEENNTNVGQLQIANLYDEHDNEAIEEFNKNIVSNLDAKLDYDKTEIAVDWLDIMEETIRYIDNILRNPNRFIVNEEDIVKIELARRVTVESIKHLSRNTNLIQEYNKDTGDIKPSKILNINKEESYDTYENRFVYSLIQNMRSYVNFKKKALQAVTVAKDDKRFKYSGTTRLGHSRYNLELILDSTLDTSNEENVAENALARIEKLENRITDLTSSEVYKTINKLHITLVTSPIKKTNVILKNTNFQYALRLWNYMQEHMDSNINNVSETKEEKVEGRIKEYSDEIFLLEYLILDSYTGEKARTTLEKKKEVSKKIINSMLQKLLEMDAIDKKEILELIDKYYTVVKYKNVVNDKEIHNKFKIAIKSYVERFDSIDLETNTE